MDEILYIWLQEQVKIIGDKARELIESFGGIKKLYEAEQEDLFCKAHITSKELMALSDKDLRGAEEIYNNCIEYGISILNISSPFYPNNLKEIDSAPLVLYYKGTWRNFEENIGIAIVGQRKASAIGKMNAEKIGYELAKNKAFVISGLAAGIDGYAHRGALKADGYTVGVLGTGLDVYYPVENAGLMRTMFKNGLVISEFPPKTQGYPTNFPKRNRIVSALSKGVVVIEAKIKSGSLITARLAREQNRDVFALVGDSEGCRDILAKQLAIAVNSAQDILSHYGFEAEEKKEKPKANINELENDILRQIALGKKADEILDILDIEVSTLTRKLNQLEIKGYIVKVGHLKYEISK